MAKKKIVLTFPPETVAQPITYHLVKDYDLVTNILRAEIREEETGHMVLELTGESERIEDGLEYLRGQKVTVQEAAKDITLDQEACVDCGACTAVCPTNALSVDRDTWRLDFDKESCILCELCVNACPVRAIKVLL
jgi:ferredoxin